MELAFSQDQQQLFDAFEQFFSKESSPGVVRRAEPLGFDRSLWEALEQMELWGSEPTLSDLCVIAETVGRALAPVPFVEHAVATRLLGLQDGAAIGALALRPTVAGTWHLVPAGAVADIVVGVDGTDLVATTSAPPLDGPRNHASAPIADRAVDGDRRVIGAAADLERPLAEWKLLTGATLVGIAARSLEIAVDYVKERHQFGVPIGSFQAVQHGLAEFPGLIDGARLLTHEAAAAFDSGSAGVANVVLNDIDDPLALASMAFLFASDVATNATDRSLHFHGGYGFAEEYDIQLYYRRARGWPLILGDPSFEYRSLADRFWPAEVA